MTSEVVRLVPKYVAWSAVCPKLALRIHSAGTMKDVEVMKDKMQANSDVGPSATKSFWTPHGPPP